MSHKTTPTPPQITLGRRVPGVACSLGIAAGCLGLSLLIAWHHPSVVLTCSPREVQPPATSGFHRLIMDGTVRRCLWGLFPVGREDLRNLSHFTMHTETTASGSRIESVHAMTHDGSREVFREPVADGIQRVSFLNSHLDRSSPGPLTSRRTDWPWLIASWLLLLLGGLVFVRNVIIAPWKRRRRSPHAGHR